MYKHVLLKIEMFQTNLKEGILHIVVEDVNPVPFYSSVPQTIHMGFHRTLHFTVQGTVTSHPIGTREPYRHQRTL